MRVLTLLSTYDPAPRRESAGPRTDRGATLALRYAEHSRRLLKLAALLVPEIAEADEVMYGAFEAMYRARGRVRRPEDVFAFLLRDVVARARVAMEARDKRFPPVSRGQAMTVLEAVRALPGPQREALVLRYYGQLPDEEAAAAMGIEPTALRAHAALGMAALRAHL